MAALFHAKYFPSIMPSRKHSVSHTRSPRLLRQVSAFVYSALMLLLILPPAEATIDITLQMQLGNPSNTGADTNNHDHYLIQRTVEAIDYSDNLGEPVWASWDLTAADVGSAPRSSSFFTDTTLPPNFYRVTDNDYNGVGTNNLNRGHMCPSEDRTDTVADNDLVFYMSNIIPQAAMNNQGVWADFENYCRTLAQAGNELLIICGPSGFGTNRIPSGKAVVPDYTWKIAVVVPPGGGTALSRITNTTRVIALKILNTQQATNTWPAYVTSVNQIQVDTGFTFFTALPADVASVLRTEVDGQTGPPPVIYAFAPLSGAANTNVVITGTNFDSATAVAINGVSAAFTVNSGTQITATVPTNDTSGLISITTPNGTAISSSNFTVIGGTGGGTAYTNILAGWDVSGSTGYGGSPLAPSTNGPNLTVTGLTRGSGVTTSGTAAGRAWGGNSFTSSTAAAAIAANQFATFSIAANTGYTVSFSSVSRFDYRRSSTGAATGVLQYQLGAGAFVDITNLSYSVSTSSGAAIGAIDLSSFAPLQNVGASTNVTFRIVNYGGTSSSGNWYVYDVAGSGAPDLSLQGIVAPVVDAAAPGLTIAITNLNSIVASWPASATGFGLQQNSNLQTNWVPVTNAVMPVAGGYQVILPLLSSNSFFRLAKP
jgi:DNA/RNA endonuclease G (NUC1)